MIKKFKIFYNNPLCDIYLEKLKPNWEFDFDAIKWEFVEKYVENGCDINYVDEYDCTLLNYISSNPYFFQLKHFKYLIENGANINTVNDYDITPINNLVINLGNYEFIKYLIENGANINYCDDDYAPPIYNLLFKYSKRNKKKCFFSF